MVTFTHADVLTDLRTHPDAMWDACLCDPPYGLSFMGKGWDHGVPSVEVWREVLRVLKPGAMLLAFGGTRTHHRLMCAIEDAGFEIRDTLCWLYGQGFPKSHNISVALSKAATEKAKHDVRFVRALHLSKEVYACAECGQVLQPTLPQSNTQDHGAKSEEEPLWGAQSRVEGRGDILQNTRQLLRCAVCTMSHGILADGTEGRIRDGAPPSNGASAAPLPSANRTSSPHRPQALEQFPGEPDAVFLERRAQAFRGYGSALKPSHEPIILAMKPLAGTFAENALAHGVAGLAIDASRVVGGPSEGGKVSGGSALGQGSGWNAHNNRATEIDRSMEQGRWPANLLLDEEAAARLDEQSGDCPSGGSDAQSGRVNGPIAFGLKERRITVRKDSGGASRFFYCAKASSRERGEGNNHPTVKPLALAEYLARLILPPARANSQRSILIPYSGSGSEAIGAVRAGWEFIYGIDNEAAYVEIARRRVESVLPSSADSPSTPINVP